MKDKRDKGVMSFASFMFPEFIFSPFNPLLKLCQFELRWLEFQAVRVLFRELTT
jgi:hypothetical protein